MRDEDHSNLITFDHDVDDIAPTVELKVQGLTSDHVQKISRCFPIESCMESETNTWRFQAQYRAFGTHKIQTVRLLALALIIYEHFPHAQMALAASTEIELTSPLRISEASQIYLQHAGFNLKTDPGDRTLSTNEMGQIKEHFLSLHNNSRIPNKRAS
jgi:hypothetical protein